MFRKIKNEIIFVRSMKKVRINKLVSQVLIEEKIEILLKVIFHAD